VWNLQAMDADMFVVRHSQSGAPHLIARHVKPGVAVINARDGRHSHPTQGLLDVYTIRHYKKDFSGLPVAIVGDVLHSRVARSNILAFRKLGARVTLCGPPTLMPRGIEALGCEVVHSLDGLSDADVVYALRMQRERMTEAFVPSLREYAERAGIAVGGAQDQRIEAVDDAGEPLDREVERNAGWHVAVGPYRRHDGDLGKRGRTQERIIVVLAGDPLGSPDFPRLANFLDFRLRLERRHAGGQIEESWMHWDNSAALSHLGIARPEPQRRHTGHPCSE